MRHSVISRWFLQHPADVGESYGQHLRAALGFSSALCLAALQCFVHALVPGLFVKSASQRLEHLMAAMQRQPAPDEGAQQGESAPRERGLSKAA